MLLHICTSVSIHGSLTHTFAHTEHIHILKEGEKERFICAPVSGALFLLGPREAAYHGRRYVVEEPVHLVLAEKQRDEEERPGSHYPACCRAFNNLNPFYCLPSTKGSVISQEHHRLGTKPSIDGPFVGDSQYPNYGT